MLVGLLIAGILAVVVPQDYFTKLLGTGIVVKLIMMMVGIPIYVCATASVPIAAVLVSKGVSPGAALVFLMTGPATNAAAIAIVWKLLGKRTAVVYLLVVALLSLGFGTMLDAIFTAGDFSAEPGMSWMIPAGVKTAAAVVLLGMLAAGIVRPYLRRSKGKGKGFADSVTLDIDGMTCSHCAGAVERALREVRDVSEVEVDLEDGRAVVSGKDLDPDALCGAVAALGYRAAKAGPDGSPG
jgi:copper chaperone CopZ